MIRKPATQRLRVKGDPLKDANGHGRGCIQALCRSDLGALEGGSGTEVHAAREHPTVVHGGLTGG